MILPISTCKFDAKNTPDAFKHVPGLFWRLRDRKTRKKQQNLKKLKTFPQQTASFFFARRKPGGGVYIYIYIYSYELAEAELRGD